MNNETTDTELTPGTRVILTGWKYPSKSQSARRDFKSFGLKLPIEAVAVDMLGKIYFDIPRDATSLWDTILFTYEIIKRQ